MLPQGVVTAPFRFSIRLPPIPGLRVMMLTIEPLPANEYLAGAFW